MGVTITVNPDLNLVVEQPLSRLPLAVVKLPRGSKVPIWVQFARDGAVIDPSEALTSGTLVVGLYYKITTFVAGDSFTNVGAASNATSVYFLCTGTTPTTWTNSSTLQQCDSAGVLFSLIFSVKKNGEYDGAVLVLATGTDFTKFGTGTSTIFKSKCSFSTAEINTLLGVDSSVSNDESEVTLMGEVSWLGPDESKAFPFQIDLQNDSYKTNDVVTSNPGVQAMSLVTTSAEPLLPGSRVLTAGSNITITANSGTVTIASTGGGGSGTVTSVAQSFTGGLISVAGSPITSSGTLALTVAGTSGGIPYFSSGTTWATSAALAASALVVGGGAGAAPATITTGANVLTALGVAVGSSGAFITFNGDAGTPSALVGTNITGTASGLTAGNATLAATVTVANEATDTTCFPLFATAATGSLAALSNAGLTFNSATGLLSATGLAGEFNGTVGATTQSTVAGTTGTFSGAVSTFGISAPIYTSGESAYIYTSGEYGSIYTSGISAPIYTSGINAYISTFGASGYIYTNGASAQIYTTGQYAYIATFGENAYISTGGASAYIQTRSTFKLYNGTHTTTLSHAPTDNRAIAFPDATGTLLLSDGSGANLTALNASNVSSGTLAAARMANAGVHTGDATGTFPAITLNAAQTGITSVGTLTGGATGAGFTVALSTSTLTGRIGSANNTLANADTTSMTAVTTLGAAGVVTNMPGTTSASSATTGALTIGNGTAATNVGIGGGNINAGGTIVAGGNISSQYITLASGRITINSAASTTSRLTNGSTSGWLIVDNQSGVGGAVLLGGGSGNPGIFRSGTTLQVRLADNSADAPISASNGTLSGTLSVTGATTLGTAGSAVGTIGFNNATSGTTTLSPATGALGTGTVTLPTTGTLATLAGTEAFTGKTYEGNTITTGTGTLTLSTFTLTAATTGTVFTSGTKADVLDAACFAEDAGANDTYTATLSPAITAYVTGAHYRFKANTANTGAATINLNALGAKTIVKAAGGITTALADNDIRAGQWVDLVYDGTNMQMQSTLGNAAAGGGSGAVIAVKSVTKTDTQTTTSPIGTAWVDITSLSITYTPTSASNKILISLSLQGSTDSTTIMFVRVVRDGSLVGVANTAGSRTKMWTEGYESNIAVLRSICGQFLDAPADTSSHTWKVQFCTHATAGTACVNRTSTDTDNSAYGRAISTMTIMEVTP